MAKVIPFCSIICNHLKPLKAIEQRIALDRINLFSRIHLGRFSVRINGINFGHFAHKVTKSRYFSNTQTILISDKFSFQQSIINCSQMNSGGGGGHSAPPTTKYIRHGVFCCLMIHLKQVQQILKRYLFSFYITPEGRS